MENEIKELKVYHQTAPPLYVSIISGCGYAERGVRVAVTAKTRPTRPDQRAVDEVPLVDRHRTALLTAAEWH